MAAALVAFAPAATAGPSYPPPDGFVVDSAGVLSPSAHDRLEGELAGHAAGYGSQIALAVIPSTGGTPIERYARELFNSWGLGDAERDDGVLLVVAVEDRTLRIQVGDGLVDVLTDDRAAVIVERDIVPRLADGNLEGGVSAGLMAIREALGEDVVVRDPAPVVSVGPMVDGPGAPRLPVEGPWHEPVGPGAPGDPPVGAFVIVALVLGGAALAGRAAMGPRPLTPDRCPWCRQTIGVGLPSCPGCGHGLSEAGQRARRRRHWWSGGGGGAFGGGSSSGGGWFGGGSSSGHGSSGSWPGGGSSSSSPSSRGGGSSSGGGASGSW